MSTTKTFALSKSERKQAVNKLIDQSTPHRSFFIMIGLAVILATLGLLTGQIVIVLSGMLVAPLLSPILCIGLGVVLADFKLIKRSAWVVIKSIVIAIVLGIFATVLLLIPLKEENQLLTFISPHITYVYISIAAGIAATFAISRPNLSEMLPGVAVAVTLIPPLSTIGIGVAKFQPTLVVESIGVFLINLVFIILASVVVFSLMRFDRERQLVSEAIEEEQKMLNNEKSADEK